MNLDELIILTGCLKALLNVVRSFGLIASIPRKRSLAIMILSGA